MAKSTMQAIPARILLAGVRPRTSPATTCVWDGSIPDYIAAVRETSASALDRTPGNGIRLVLTDEEPQTMRAASAGIANWLNSLTFNDNARLRDTE